MDIKVFEGEDLETLIEKAKRELGEVDILYYEVEKKRRLIPFFTRKTFRLFVVPKNQKEENREEPVEQLEKEIEEIKEMLVGLKESIKTAAPPPPHPEVVVSSEIPTRFAEEFAGDAFDLIKLLVDKGVKPEIAADVVREACGLDIELDKLDLNTATFKEALIKGISAKVKFTGELVVSGRTIYAFVGPTGVGKTTNLFKIASRLVIDKNLKVGVITTDTFKVGAVQQVRTYASILNIPFYVVTDSKKMKETLKSLEDLDVILIDTVGRSHYDYWRLGEIKATLFGADVPINTILLISCNYSTDEAVEVVNRYRSFFPIYSLFFTKVDETSKPGLMINLPVMTGLPVSYVSTGQRVPEDIKLLSPEVLADFFTGS